MGRAVSLRFSDLGGSLKEVLVAEEKYEESQRRGIWFDGSSIQGFVRRYESDMRLVPDEQSMLEGEVRIVFCDVYTSDKPFEGDPRYVLKRALEGAKKLGFTRFETAAEPEFYAFRDDKPIDSGGYLDVAPKDEAIELKKRVIEELDKLGIEWEVSHHEVGPGQDEIDIKHSEALATADRILIFKSTVKQIGRKLGLRTTFMPKPMEGLPGNGMHVHQSLLRKEENTFYDPEDEYRLSDVAKNFVAGLLEHCKALTAVTNPTVNSYKRLGEFEAPCYKYWGRKNRDALIRIPEFIESASARIEYRSPDSTCNPYLCFAALLEAGLDGIRRRIDPPAPIEEDIYSTGICRKLEKLPKTLKEALDELERDEVVKESLGKAYENFVTLKMAEWDEYNRSITNWETRKYFELG